MGIDDNIGYDPILRVRHVFMGIDHSDGALLPVTRGELIADFGDLQTSYTDVREAIAIAIPTEIIGVHEPLLIGLQTSAIIPIGVGRMVLERRDLPDNDILRRDVRIDGHESIGFQFIVVTGLGQEQVIHIGFPKEILIPADMILLDIIAIGPIEGRGE